jgi:hypothetical protein
LLVCFFAGKTNPTVKPRLIAVSGVGSRYAGRYKKALTGRNFIGFFGNSQRTFTRKYKVYKMIVSDRGAIAVRRLAILIATLGYKEGCIHIEARINRVFDNKHNFSSVKFDLKL